MKKQKSTYTMRSPEDPTARSNFDQQYPMATMAEGPSSWENNWSNDDYNKMSYFTTENQIYDPSFCYLSQAPWQQFCFPQEGAKPELIATTSDIYDDCSDVSLPIDFSDFESLDGVELQEPFPQFNCLQTPAEPRAEGNQNVPMSSPFNEFSFGLHKLPYYPSDIRNTMFQYNIHPRLCLSSFRSASIVLRHLVSVDVSPEGAIYVHNIPGQNIAVVNDAGDKACIIHPNSRVLQEGQNVHIMTHQARLVKICRRGVIFRSSPSSIVYLVDESGTKSTSGKFTDLCQDYTSEVFYGSMSKDFQLRCTDSLGMLSNATYQSCKNGDDVWCVGGAQIKQDQFGNIEVSREKDGVSVTILPTAGEVTIRSSFFSATVGCYSKRYLNVQKGDCHVSSGFCGLTAQKSTQKAGLDRYGKVVIF